MTDAVHQLEPVGLDFLETAPHRFDYRASLDAPCAAVFDAISSDPSTWGWFPGIEAGAYEGDEPAGVGTRRWVRIGGVKYRETMLAWDAPHAVGLPGRRDVGAGVQGPARRLGGGIGRS